MTRAVQVLEPVVEAWRAAFGPRLEAVVLFGSRARGDARADSDWDLLVLLRDLPRSPLQRSQLVLDALPARWRYLVRPLVLTPEEWFRRVPPIALDIAWEGLVLHDAQGRVTRGLHSLRAQMEAAGLQRKRTAEGWLWLWRTPRLTAPNWSWEAVGA